MTNIFLYDPHTWEGERDFTVATSKNRFHIQLQRGMEKTSGNALVFIADELCGTHFPYFFPKCSRVALLKESPIFSNMLDVADLRKKFYLVLTHQKELADLGKPFVLLEYSANWVERDPAFPDLFCKTRLVSCIHNALHTSKEAGYRFRTKVFDALNQRKDIDFFGRGVKNIEYKTMALNKYRFSIVMENYRSDYYFSEKLIDCFLTETVPIYWGCPGIGDLFEQQGILSFSSLDELVRILDIISPDTYTRLQPYLIKNEKKCHAMHCNNFSGYFRRCVEAVENDSCIRPSKLSLATTSKMIAFFRYGMSKLVKRE